MAIVSGTIQRSALFACAFFSLSSAVAQTAVKVPADLPNAKFYATFSWPRAGSLSGETPAGSLFADPRIDQNALASDTRRGTVAWFYTAGEKTPRIAIEVPAMSGRNAYSTNAALLGYDRDQAAYVKVIGDENHPAQVICKVDNAGIVTVVSQVPDGLSATGPSAGQIKRSPTQGMILGDERGDIREKVGMAQGKVSWSYNYASSEPDSIRVVLIDSKGYVGSPHAELQGFDSARNAYVQISPTLDDEFGDFNGFLYRIDAQGMPTRVDALPDHLWDPNSTDETAASPAPVAPKSAAPVVAIPGGKYTVSFIDPDTHQPTSAVMERLAASQNADTPFDGVYHNEKFMVMVRNGEARVSPNRIPMGFHVPGTPQN